MKECSIAHISDLHCKVGVRWKKSFNRVKNLLIKDSPDVIIITGDCVDEPLEANFDFLIEHLNDLYTKITNSRKEPLYIITIPGNHDIRGLAGNEVGFFKGLFSSKGPDADEDEEKKYIESSLFYKHEKQLLFPSPTSLEELVLEIFETFEIAIFPFDSNKKGFFARGKVEEPENIFDKYQKKFKGSAKSKGFEYTSCVKIAILHHHPLPLPTSKKQEKAEPFLIMVNSNEFLKSALDYEINHIYHGHKHTSVILRYEEENQKNKLPLVISACSSSSKPSEHTKEVKIITFDEIGSSYCKSYTSVPEDQPFKNRPNENNKIQLTPYGLSRKHRCQNAEPSEGNKDIKSVRTKTKLVNIDVDGSAAVNVILNGITLNTEKPNKQFVIKEHLRADFGRIRKGSTEFLYGTKYSNDTQFWDTKSTGVFDQSRLMSDQCYELNATLSNSFNHEDEVTCNIVYPHLNGYALDDVEHDEIYGGILSDMTVNDPYESISIRSSYPTEVLELIVKFPDGKFPSEFVIDPILEIDEEQFCFLKRKYSIRNQEQKYLSDKYAISERPVLNEVAVSIRHPQPDLIYALRWKVPKVVNKFKFANAKEINTHRKLLHFFNSDSPALNTFCKKIKSLIIRGLNRDNDGNVEANNDIDIAFLGHMVDESCLKVSASTLPEIVGVGMRMGRGLAGSAFRTRRPVTYHEKDDDGKSHLFQHKLEEVKPNFNPKAVVSIPLMYPRAFSFDQDKALPPPFGVVSILTNDDDNTLAENLYPEEGIKDGKKQQSFLNSLDQIIWSALVNMSESLDIALEENSSTDAITSE